MSLRYHETNMPCKKCADGNLVQVIRGKGKASKWVKVECTTCAFESTNIDPPKKACKDTRTDAEREYQTLASKALVAACDKFCIKCSHYCSGPIEIRDACTSCKWDLVKIYLRGVTPEHREAKNALVAYEKEIAQQLMIEEKHDCIDRTNNRVRTPANFHPLSKKLRRPSKADGGRKVANDI